MKEVEIKKGTRVCSKELGGCGRTIWSGEIAWVQERSKKKWRRRRFLCKECYEKKAY